MIDDLHIFETPKVIFLKVPIKQKIYVYTVHPVAASPTLSMSISTKPSGRLW